MCLTLENNMAAALIFIRRVQYCVYLRSYLTKPSVTCGARCDYKLGLCKRDFHDGRKWPRRSLSTTQQIDHDEKERRIMVVLRKKQGELVPQLQEEDLLDYFSAYGEIEDVIWARTNIRHVGSQPRFRFHGHYHQRVQGRGERKCDDVDDYERDKNGFSFSGRMRQPSSH